MATQIHPTAIVDTQAQLGQDVRIGPYSIVGPKASIGDRTSLASHVCIEGDTMIGNDCGISSFTVLGGPPQDLGYKKEPTKLIIGNNNIIREHVTMNVASNKGDGITQVGDHGMFMIATHIAHDCKVGDYIVMANNGTLAGHVTVGNYAIIGGLSVVQQFVHIGEHAMIGGMSGVDNDVIPYGMVKGERAHLCGLNLVGLRRRGFERDDIYELRKAYRILFFDEGTLDERLYSTESMFGDNELVMGVLDFIRRDSQRTLLCAKPMASV